MPRATRPRYDPGMPFSKFGLGEGILRAIKKVGYARPTPVQTAAIPKAMEGKDLIAIAQTGTGKTAAFVWPMLHRLSQRKAENGARESWEIKKARKAGSCCQRPITSA